MRTSVLYSRAKWTLASAIFAVTILVASSALAVAPTIWAEPGWGAIGDQFEVHGYDIGPAAPQVYFMPGNIPAQVVEYRPGEADTDIDQAVCIIPKGVAAYSKVYIVVGGQISNQTPYIVNDDVIGWIWDGHGGGLYSKLMEGAVGDVKVELKNADTGEVLATDYTIDAGLFRIRHVLDNSIKYRVFVTMKTKDGKIRMNYQGGDTITFWRDFKFTNADWESTQIFPMKWKLSDTSKTDGSNISKDDLDNCASIWSWVQKNREVAKATGNDLGSPITVSTFSAPTAYFLNTRTIRIDADDSNDDSADGYPPPWQFVKNRESHEFGHALMHSILGYGDVAAADIGNHAGYANKNTGDSLAEGFAEFWACYVDKKVGITGSPEVYDGFGNFGATGVWKAWSPLLTAKPLDTPLGNNVEEFAVATALYKLEPLVGINRIAAALPKGGTFTTFYNNVSPGRVDKVRPLFVGQGFFSDTDGDWVWDANEPVGAGNGVKIKISADGVTYVADKRLNRKKHPSDPNEFVGIKLSGTTSATAESQVTVAVTNPANPAGNYTYRTRLIGTTGKVLLPIPPGYNARITVIGPAGTPSADTLNITAAQWAAAKAAKPAGAAMSATFKVQPAPPGDPTDCTLGPSAQVVGYGRAAVLSGELTSANEYLPDIQVRLQRSATANGPWANDGDPIDTDDGSYQFIVKPGTRTFYRVVSQQTSEYWSSRSPAVSVTPQALVGNPVAPSVMRRTRYYTVTALMKPKHAARSYPIRIYKWRKIGTKWVSYGFVKARAANYGAYSRCSVRLRLAKKGKWRLLAYHADAGHAVSRSPRYDYVTVK